MISCLKILLFSEIRFVSVQVGSVQALLGREREKVSQLQLLSSKLCLRSRVMPLTLSVYKLSFAIHVYSMFSLIAGGLTNQRPSHLPAGITFALAFLGLLLPLTFGVASFPITLQCPG